MSAAEQINRPAFRVLCDSRDRAKWLGMRRQTVGASESAAILGVSAWGSALELWAEKLGKVEREDLSGSEVIFWGNALEDAIIRGYSARTQRAAVPFGLMLRSERWPWLTCTPDALVSESADVDAQRDLSDAIDILRERPGDPLTGVAHVSVETELTSGRWWPLQTKNIGFGSAEHWQEGVPVYYRVQCVHEALVCGTRRVTGAALVAGQKLVWDDIDVAEPSEGLLERQIVSLTRAFVRDHLETGVEPETDGSESAQRALAKLYPFARPGSVAVLGAAMMEVAYDLEMAKDAEKTAAKKVRELENQIKQAIGDAESATFPDGSGFTLKTQKRAAMQVAACEFRVLRRKKARGE